MTWFETEQLYNYIDRLETALDEWRLSRFQMQSRKVELVRLHNKINREMSSPLQPSKKDILSELSNRIEQCQEWIDERLKY